MSPQSLLRVKHRILNTNLCRSEGEATACFKLRTSSAVEERLSAFAEREQLSERNERYGQHGLLNSQPQEEGSRYNFYVFFWVDKLAIPHQKQRLSHQESFLVK